MSTILLVQRHRMLQQAIAVSLFPEHEVRVATSAPDAGSIADVDAVIIDGAWTDERDAFLEGSVRAARKANLPIIWIEGAASSRPPQYDRLVVIRTPIERSALKAALAESLARSGRPESAQPLPGAAGVSRSAESDGATKTLPTAADVGGKKVIDLVEIVEEPPPRSKIE